MTAGRRRALVAAALLAVHAWAPVSAQDGELEPPPADTLDLELDPDSAVLWQNVPGPWRSESIADLEFDDAGRLLVLTRQDLWRLEGEAFVRVPGFDGRTHGSRVATIVPGGQDVWTSHKDELCRWRAGDWTCYPVAPHQPGEIAFAGPDDGWAACDWNFMRIFRWDGERWTPLVEPLIPRHSANHLVGMTLYGPGDVWLMGHSTDLVHYDGEGFHGRPPPPGVNQRNEVREVCPLPDGRLVAMSDQAWLGDDRGWTALEGTDGMTRCFVEGDAVWLSGGGGRLTRFDGEAMLDTPAVAAVQEMVFGPDGQGWAAQGGRLLQRVRAEGAVYLERAQAAGLEYTGKGHAAIFFPLDDDGAPELLLFNQPLEVRLYRNDGKGRFFDATADQAAAIVPVEKPCVAACDLDNDGDADLIVGKGGDRSEDQKLAYYRNKGGRFEDVTRQGGLAPDDLTHKRLRELDCVDLDFDGDLDLFATVQSQDDSFPEQNVAYENVGHGVLRQRRLPARGLGGGQHWTNTSAFVDLFGDGRPELVSVNVWNVGHAVFQAGDDGAWHDITDRSGIGHHYGHGGATLAEDLDGDGTHDLLVMEGARRRFYRNDGERLHEVPLLGADGLPLPLREGPGGPAADDVDFDGDLDLLLASKERGVRLLRNDGGFTFRDISVSAGVSVGRSEKATFADIEGDGDLDALVITGSGRNRLLVNAARGGGRTLRLRSVRQAVAGADVRLLDGGGALLARRTVPQDGGAVSLPPRAGDGERLVVRLSDGTTVELDAPAEERAVVGLERGPAWLAGWLSGTVARRLTWAHRDEAGLRIAGFTVVLLLLFAVGRRKALLRFGRWPTPLVLLLAYPAVEFAVAGAGEATRWGAAGGAVLAVGALAWLDLRATRWRRATWVAHFRIERELGTGGMGTVYLARDTVANREVALKILRPEIARRPDARERFIREAELGARFSHPNLVRIFEHGDCRVFTGDEARRTSYLSMEFIDGKSLRAWVEGHDGIRTGQACRLVVSLLDALQTLHDAGVVHRDIKPDNVMLTPRGDLKITDFGLARGGGHETLTRTGDVMGTMSYMPPEQAETGRVSEAADIYAAGVMAYELLAGRLPFVGADPMQTLYKIFTEEPPPLAELCPDLPGPLVAAVHRAMEKDPAQRWPSASAFAEALLPYADQSVVTRSLRTSRSSRSRIRAELRPPTTGPGGTIDAAARPPGWGAKPAEDTGAETRPALGEERVTRVQPTDAAPERDEDGADEDQG